MRFLNSPPALTPSVRLTWRRKFVALCDKCAVWRTLALTLESALVLALALHIPIVESRAQRASETVAQPTAQESPSVDSLVAWALAVSPKLRAAQERIRAANARVRPAGTRPDPMLMAGLQNFPVSDPGFSDFMTMKMIGVVQAIPYPGKLSLSTLAATNELVAVEAEREGASLEVQQMVRDAYYELAYLDRALEIVERNRGLLLDFMKVTETKYGVGTGGQEEVLRVRVEVARLGEQSVALVEMRRATQADLNAALDRPSETPIANAAIPLRISRAAVADSAADIRFVSATMGARAADSPIPQLHTLQDDAVRQNPILRAHGARIDAQRAREALAQKQHLPDFDVSLSYGQRDGFSDMITAQVSIPIPLQRARKQNLLVVEAGAELAALEAELHDRENTLRAEVARLHAALERDRAQLALYVKAILPQGHAALTSATAGYQVGRADFLSLIDAQATLFSYELTYFRVLSDFAKTLAQLERVVGEQVLP